MKLKTWQKVALIAIPVLAIGGYFAWRKFGNNDTTVRKRVAGTRVDSSTLFKHASEGREESGSTFQQG